MSFRGIGRYILMNEINYINYRIYRLKQHNKYYLKLNDVYIHIVIKYFYPLWNIIFMLINAWYYKIY